MDQIVKDARKSLAADRLEAFKAAVPASDERELDASKLLQTLWSRRWTLALFLAVAIAATVAYLSVATRIYRAQAVVAIELSEQTIIDLEAVTTGITGDTMGVNLELQVLRSRNLLGRVVDRMRLTEDPEFNAALQPPSMIARALSALGLAGAPEAPESELEIREATIDALLERQRVTPVPQAPVFVISVDTTDPEKSAAIANAVADLYILDQLEAKFTATEQATLWLSDRVAELKIALEEAESKIEDYTAASSLVSEESLLLQGQQLSDMRDRVARTGAERAEAEAQLAELRRLRATGDRSALATLPELPPAARLGLEQLARGAGTEAERAQVASRVELLLDAVESRLAQSVDQAGIQVTALEGSIATLEAEIGRQSNELLALRQLRREAEATRVLYESFLTRMKETSVQQGLHQADARVLSPAVIRVEAASPRPGVLLILAALGGLFAGVIYVLAADLMNTSFKTARQLQGFTGIPVMASVPEAPVRRRRAVLDYLIEKPGSGLAEAIGNLKTSILLSNIDNPPQIIMLTSAAPGEGKTTLSIGLSVNAAAMGKRVLLVECDFRRRVFGTYFGTTGQPGLLSVLAGTVALSDAIVRHEASGLDVIVGERSPSSATDVFASERFAKFLEEMRQSYDFIILDTPPVLAVPDARMIAAVSDALIFAVHWGKTTRDMVREALAQFQQIEVGVFGLALTQVNQRRMARYGYGGYGSYREIRKYYTT